MSYGFLFKVIVDSFKLERDIGITAIKGSFALKVIGTFGFVIFQETGIGEFQKLVLMMLVNGEAPSIIKFGGPKNKRLTFGSVLKNHPILKIKVAINMTEE
jgi:hypothetical protein